MKTNPVLYAQMERYYQRFQESNLSRPAFCQAEGLAYAQFCYWCKRLAKENAPLILSNLLCLVFTNLADKKLSNYSVINNLTIPPVVQESACTVKGTNGFVENETF